MSHKKIVQQFTRAMGHKHDKGEKVRIIAPHKMAGSEGEIASRMPYTFVEPAYYVNVHGMTIAVSEQSLEPMKGDDDYEQATT